MQNKTSSSNPTDTEPNITVSSFVEFTLEVLSVTIKIKKYLKADELNIYRINLSKDALKSEQSKLCLKV